MNILLISPNSPFESIGGIERYISNLIAFYKINKKHKLFIVLPNKDKSYIENIGNVTILFEKTLFIPKNWKNLQKETNERARKFSLFVEKAIKENNINIICAENILFGTPSSYVLLVNMIAIQNNIPLVLQLHSFLVTDLQVELTNQLMWSQVSCVSKSVAGDCFNKGADINILSTHYLGVDTNEFNENKVEDNFKTDLGFKLEDKIILTATRIIRGEKNILQEKGITNLIQAFSKLSPRYPNLKLLIAVGKAPDSLKQEFDASLEMLEGYIKLNNVKDNTVIKLFKLEEMPKVYKVSHLFVLPSQNETFGQVFLEAMATGVPVIGTKVGGIPEIITDSYNGYLVAPDDSSILAQRMEKVIMDENMRERFIKFGLSTVNKYFTAETQFLYFQQMLEELVVNQSSHLE